MTEQRIEADIRVAAPVEAVWEAWADPERLASWYVDRAEGRIGQDDRVTWVWGQMGMNVEYEVVEHEPERRFVLRTETPEGRRGTEVELTPDGGFTHVHVVERGFDTDPSAVRSGWQMALGLLKVYLEVYYGREVRSVLVMAKTEATPEELVAAQRTAEGLSRWVASASPSSMPGQGESMHLELEDGVEVDGQVVQLTETETSLTWPAITGVLELKQFPVGEDRAAAMRAFTWAPEQEVELEEVQELLTDTLERFMSALEPA